MTSTGEALLGALFGGLLVLMGGIRMAGAPTIGGLVAGLLMAFSGLVLSPHGRMVLESVSGSSMTRDEAVSLFLLALLGSFALNIVSP